ncbi:uncharacterized protein LOC128736696 [Sabethes cyaneus]|uniref:uncharacterized protein LOC128736696 n=1 Tax=Sabethes cyaneus TaxID=53552 RepID=UPI00237D36A8|nr:uncharacterized protein LOC128736696 [Sabethes cyaneus]
MVGHQFLEGSNPPVTAQQSCQYSSFLQVNRADDLVSSGSAAKPDLENSRAGTRSNILLATAMILLIDDAGDEYPVRALLDSGSECSFIAERIAQRMSIHQNKVSISVTGIGQASTQVQYKFRSTVKSRITNFSTMIELLVLPKVTVDLPSMSVDVTSWPIPTGIKLADPFFYEFGSVDVVLGAEVFFDLFKTSCQIPLGNTLPTLVKLVLGWIVSGKASEHTPHSIVCNVAATAGIHHNMESFWTIKKDSKPAHSPEETLRDTICNETLSRVGHHNINEIYGRGSPACPREENQRMKNFPSNLFIPHHSVIREESSATKVRIEISASFISKGLLQTK